TMITQSVLEPKAEHSLTMAVISSSTSPVLLLTSELMLLAASTSFCRAFQIEAASVAECPLSRLGTGEWGAPQLGSLLRATASGAAEIEAYEMDLNRDGH